MVVSLQPTLRSIFWKAWVQCWFQQTGFKTCPCKDDGFHSAPALKKKHGTNSRALCPFLVLRLVMSCSSHVSCYSCFDMLWGMVPTSHIITLTCTNG